MDVDVKVYGLLPWLRRDGVGLRGLPGLRRDDVGLRRLPEFVVGMVMWMLM